MEYIVLGPKVSLKLALTVPYLKAYADVKSSTYLDLVAKLATTFDKHMVGFAFEGFKQVPSCFC